MRTFNELFELIKVAVGKLSDSEIEVVISQVSENMVQVQTLTYEIIGFVLITADKTTGDVSMHFMPITLITGQAQVADIVVSADDLPENKGQRQITAFILEIYNAIVVA